MNDGEQPTGLRYLITYPGMLKCMQEIVNVLVIVVLFFVESSLKTTILNIIAVYASVITFVLLTLNVLGVVRKTLLPWHWIQAVNSLATCGLYILASIWVILVLEARIVIAGIIGIIGAVVYFLDMLDNYRRAVEPKPQYVWNVPTSDDDYGA